MKNSIQVPFLTKLFAKGLIMLIIAIVGISPQSAFSAVKSDNVTLSISAQPLQKALDEIEKQTGYSFLVNSNVDTRQKVSVKFTNTNVNKAMEMLLKDTGINFSIKENHIILSMGNNQPSAAPANARSGVTNIKVSGTVYDDMNEPLIGAAVKVKNSDIAVTTDIDGNFTLPSVPENAVLQISYVGTDPQEINLARTKDLSHIVLTSSANELSELVVIGYGVQKKRDVSTAISSIKADDIANQPNSDFRQAMAGKMPGVTVLQTGGDPEGSNVMVRVRGVGSATAGNDPLYIIDGVPVETGLSNLNPNDVESMEVLKDASAAAIYGSRGSNGVVIITTKKGTSEKLTVTYDGYFGIEKVSKKIDMLNAYEFAQLAKEGHDNAYYDLHPGGTDPNGKRPESYSNYPVELDPYLEGVPGLTDTDWQDAIFRTAHTTSHNLAFSGKSGTFNYFISGNYYKKEGIIINSDFEKYSFRLNMDGSYKRLKYGANFSPSYSESNRVNADGAYGDGGVVQAALASVPLFPVYNEDGTFNYQGNGYWRIGTDYQHNEVLNPVALATLNKDQVTRMAMTGKAYVSIEIIRGLTFQTSFGGNYYGAHNNKYRASELPLQGKAYYDKKSNPVGYSSSGFYYDWLFENQLSFFRDFGDHNINAILVQSAQKETYLGNSVTATDYPNDYIQTINGGTVSKGDSKKTQWSLASYLARVQYSYKGKYMASAAIRADGSSRFGKNNRWGYFPSASVAWRISGENFFNENSALNWMNDVKIRASYGETGNFQIGNYQHLSTMASDDYILGTGNGSLVSGYKPTGISNPNLTWEKTQMINAGLDIYAFNGYLGLTLEYYNADTKDMLLNVPIPQLTGYSTTLMNVGKVNNRGWEITLTSRHSYSNGFSYSFNANWAKNINEVKALGANDTPIITTCSTSHDFFITKVGEPIGCYYLLVQDGVFKNEEELKAYPHFSNTRVGDFRFVDVDGDGVLDTDKDRTIVGNYMPDFTYGFGGTMSFKNFDFAIAFQGVYGNEILNLNRRYLASVEGNVNMMRVTLDRWQSVDNPGSGEVNRANRKATGYNGRTSTWHLEDGSYLRLQNVAIGYTLPQNLTRKFYVEKLRIYASGSNLHTWTKYTGYNPEVSLKTNALTPGVDYGTYPLARTFMCGLNIVF